MKNLFARFVREDEGQDIIEYSLLAAFISISGYVILTNIGSQVNTIYSNVNSVTSNAASVSGAGGGGGS
jgi:Flp pilus assembly pilin Flp